MCQSQGDTGSVYHASLGFHCLGSKSTLPNSKLEEYVSHLFPNDNILVVTKQFSAELCPFVSILRGWLSVWNQDNSTKKN